MLASQFSYEMFITTLSPSTVAVPLIVASTPSYLYDAALTATIEAATIEVATAAEINFFTNFIIISS
jgi:hypothetical protein